MRINCEINRRENKPRMLHVHRHKRDHFVISFFTSHKLYYGPTKSISHDNYLCKSINKPNHNAPFYPTLYNLFDLTFPFLISKKNKTKIVQSIYNVMLDVQRGTLNLLSNHYGHKCKGPVLCGVCLDSRKCFSFVYRKLNLFIIC